MEKKITEDMLAHTRVIIAEVARDHGVPESEVRAEMMAAMRAGMANPDPEVQRQWSEIPWQGAEPTVEEFIAWMTLKVEREADAEKKAN